ncbi:hypothetical protein GS870_26395, partial [Rhodococcus hoagii]|nr:hypothetical protein [Prescottella equi]
MPLGERALLGLAVEIRLLGAGPNRSVRAGTEETDLNGETQKCTFSEGHFFNLGATRIPQGHVTLDYCRELGVELQSRQPERQHDGQLHRHQTAGRAVHHLPRREGRHLRLRLGAVAEGDEPGCARRRPHQGRQGRVVGVPQQLRRPVRRRSLPGVAAPRLRLRAGGGPELRYPEAGTTDVRRHPERHRPQLRLRLRVRPSDDDAHPVGGMDRIYYRFAEEIGDSLVYGAEVTSMKNTPDGVTVEYRVNGRLESVTAEYAICTIPPHLIERLDNNLPADVLTALRAATPSSSGKLGIEYSRRWWRSRDR